MLNLVAIATLFLIPLLSIVFFANYVRKAGTGNSADWGLRHGVHEDIVRNYRWVNAVTLAAWFVTLGAILAGKAPLAQQAAIFAVAYLLCDIVFYIPMARLAREPFPADQLLVFSVQAAYAVFLPTLAAALR